jgi:hypothetical protein
MLTVAAAFDCIFGNIETCIALETNTKCKMIVSKMFFL